MDEETTGFVCLTDLVREHYVNYLERQLHENIISWRVRSKTEHMHRMEDKIKQCAQILEDSAVKACMVAQLYQRAMVKIIASVRRHSQEHRLESTLHKLIHAKPISDANKNYNNKATQTDDNKFLNIDYGNENPANKNFSNSYSSLSLNEKIDLFNVTINKENKCDANKFRQSDNSIEKVGNKLVIGETIKTTIPAYVINEDNDDIARELAQIFNEDNTDLENIFGIETNPTSDDPQINAILQEIENSKIGNYKKNNDSMSKVIKPPDVCELSKSVWPCELYMQRRLLNASLTHLLEEDIRWHDLIKWKFAIIFGEDSDDEFAICSPTIDLDEVLMGSCIRRISPWVVNYLMKPLNEGLIANRFLFKKLAKKLACTIITHNQYPNECYVKNAIEYFFCIKNTVLSIDDIEEMSTIVLKD